jgi:hypothetical protein
MEENTEQPSPTPEPAEPAATKPAFKDRVIGMRGVAAVAMASVILGGAGGAALGAASRTTTPTSPEVAGW